MNRLIPGGVFRYQIIFMFAKAQYKEQRRIPTMLVKFDIYYDGAFWCARGMGTDIFTQGKSFDELIQNMTEAVELHFEELIETGEQITVVSLTEFQVGSVAKISGC